MAYFCDNKVDNEDEEERFGIKIISFKRLKEIHRDYIVIVCVANPTASEICRQLDESDIDNYFVYEDLMRTNMLSRVKGQLEFLKAHADITALKPATGELRERQLDLVNYAADLFDFISELEIKPFLAFGSMLGAVRHQGSIP